MNYNSMEKSAIIAAERKRLGSLIRANRELKGFTQQKLADRLGVNFTTVSKIESGKFNTGINRLIEISHILEFNILIS